MRCAICKRPNEEVELFEGILKAEMVNVCEKCSRIEGIPTIRKPSTEQLENIQDKRSVRERMENLSYGKKRTLISKDQTIIQGNLARLKMPTKKETNPDVIDNYYWEINMARRRRKLSIKQLAEIAKVDPDVLDSIERGQIPKNFEEIFMRIESALQIRLLKHDQAKINFIRKSPDYEKSVLASVRRKMNNTDFSEEYDEDKSEEDLERISKAEEKFNKKEYSNDVTIDELVEIKRRREREHKSQASKRKSYEDDLLIGDEIDLD